MGDLIWVGNTLLPRSLVFSAVGIVVLTAIVVYVAVTKT